MSVRDSRTLDAAVSGLGTQNQEVGPQLALREPLAEEEQRSTATQIGGKPIESSGSVL
jgi:hypothetical protein